MRSQVTNTKMNQKNRYDSYECEACGLTDESQEHVTNCNVLLEMHNEWKPSEIPKYEKIMNGNLKEQVMICNIFSKNN